MKLKTDLPPNQRRIGLTGGIASGKSTISKYIQIQKKIQVLDADCYSKQLIMPGRNSYQKIIDRYGIDIINKRSTKQEIITKKLKNIIFNNSSEKIWIENLLHPLIKHQMMNDCINFKNQKTLILVIPLLFEANFNDLCTEIWLVKCSEECQRKRLIKREDINIDEANKLIYSQMSIQEKEAKSDEILINENDGSDWQQKLDKLL